MRQQPPHIVYTRRAPPPRNMIRLLGCLFGPLIASAITATLIIPLTCVLGIPILFMDSSQPSFFGYTAFVFVLAPIIGVALIVIAIIAGVFLGPGWVQRIIDWLYDNPDASTRMAVGARSRKRNYSNQQIALISISSVVIGACLLCGGLIAFSVWYDPQLPTIITVTPASGPTPFPTFPPLPFPTIDWTPR